MVQPIQLAIRNEQITSADADVIAMMYSEGLYGPNAAVATALANVGVFPNWDVFHVGDYRLIDDPKEAVKSKRVLFVSVPSLFTHGYSEIRTFGRRVLDILEAQVPDTQHLAMTIHGPGYGLDEVEVCLAQIAGYFDAIQIQALPPALERVTITDWDAKRAERLRAAVQVRLGWPDGASEGMLSFDKVRQVLHLESSSARLFPYLDLNMQPRSIKPHIFVSMPFSQDFEDVYYYGFQQSIHRAGFLCERTDQSSFTGDILARVLYKISNAAAVIAEISDVNPNVYLEIGYAWGKGCPTILVTRNEKSLPFDIRGQRYLAYSSIRDLESRLDRELAQLLRTT